MIAAYRRLTKEEKVLQQHLGLNFHEMTIMQEFSSSATTLALAHYYADTMEQTTIATLEKLRSDLQLSVAEFRFLVVRMPALVVEHLKVLNDSNLACRGGWLMNQFSLLGGTYVRGVPFCSHAQVSKLVIAVADKLAGMKGLYGDEFCRSLDRRTKEVPDLMLYTSMISQLIGWSFGDNLGPDLESLIDSALSKYDHDFLARDSTGYMPLMDDSLSPFEAANYHTSRDSPFRAIKQMEDRIPLIMIDLENVGNGIQQWRQLAMIAKQYHIEVRMYTAENHPLKADATHCVPTSSLPKGKKSDAVDIRMMFDAGQYTMANQKANILIVLNDHFASTAAAVVNDADTIIDCADLSSNLPAFWAKKLGVKKLSDISRGRGLSKGRCK